MTIGRIRHRRAAGGTTPGARARGYLLLPALALLLPSASLLIALGATDDAGGREYRAERVELERIRDRLVAYASGYDLLYGPRGAGPGHLPCPDTDRPSRSRWPKRAGPNPPCGRGPVATGRLPSAVSPGTRRYRFHHRPQQAFWYRVSTAFVNNPLDRIVNPDTLGDLSHGAYREVVAVVGFGTDVEDDPAPGVAPGGARAASTIAIRVADLRGPAIDRVRRWLLSRLRSERVRTSACERSRPHEIDGEQWLDWLLDSAERCGGAPAAPAAATTAATIAANATLPVESPAAPTPVAMLEGVPASRHWFVRNRWFDHVQATVTRPCREAGSRCRWIPATASGTTGNDAPAGAAIRLRLVDS